MDYKSLIIPEKLPQHVAIIMDGNGRWAKQHSKPRVFGHRNGVKAVRETTEAAAELDIKYLTLYAFSTENWNRPQLEVNALLHLLVETLSKEIHTLMENNIRLTAIGDLAALPDHTRRALLEGIEKTKANTRMTLVLALNYSGRWDIVQAARNIARSVQEGKLDPDQIDEKHFQEYLATREIPDPEFMIRTSGEQRTSNFLCYQLAYAELYFTTVLWPDFRKEHLYQAIVAYQQRERRFGMISEQLA